MSATPPLEPVSITISGAQFVGTNVEMTYLVEAPADEAEARLDALLAAKLGLYAITATGQVADPDGERRQRFSVLASPLDRLFHKIGPSSALTLIQHTSLTLDLSEVNLTRQAEGLLRTHPASDSPSVAIWPIWDAGKLLGSLLRLPAALDGRSVRLADVDVRPEAFPNELLPSLAGHVEEHGGVRVVMDAGVLQRLSGRTA